MAQYFGARNIARRMNWKSPMTPINRHERRDDPNPFPMFPWPRGRNWVWCVSDEIIVDWQRGEAELSRNRRITRARMPRRKHRKTRQKGLASGRRDWTLETLTRGKGNESLREELPPAPSTLSVACGCTCGTPIPCTSHDEV